MRESAENENASNPSPHSVSLPDFSSTIILAFPLPLEDEAMAGEEDGRPLAVEESVE